MADDELTTYAKLVGIELPKESYLLPIAQEGLHAELPADWAAYEHKDEEENDNNDLASSRHYFYNHQTQESSWFHPSDQIYKDKVIEFRNYVQQCAYALGIEEEPQTQQKTQQQNTKNNSSSSSTTLLFKIAAEMAFCPMPPEGNWEMHRDEEGRVFYQHDGSNNNDGEREATWDHPYLDHFRQQVEEIKTQIRNNNNTNGNNLSSRQPYGNSNDDDDGEEVMNVRGVRSSNNNNNNFSQQQQQQHRSIPNQDILNSKSFQNQQLPESHQRDVGGAAKSFTGSNYNEDRVRNQKLEPPKNSDGSMYVPGFDDPKDHFHPILGAPYLKDYQGYPKSGVISKDDFDSTWGAPRPKGWTESHAHEGPAHKYDEWYGPPVKVGAKRPEGMPKRALGRVAPLPTDPTTQMQQQQQMQMQNPQQQYQQLLSNPTIVGFAKYIGINPETEPHLLPLAAQALQSPLPPNWTAVKDPNSGRTYFACTTDNSTSWDHPMKDAFSKKVIEVRGQQQPNARVAEKSGSHNNSDDSNSDSEDDEKHDLEKNVDHLSQVAETYFHMDRDQLHQSSIEVKRNIQKAYEFLRLPDQQQQAALAQYFPQWTAYTSQDESHNGQKYYFNKETQETSWEPPIILELRKRI